jgi:DDE superfamily endonuclease
MDDYVVAHMTLLSTICHIVSNQQAERNASIIEQRLVWNNFVGKYGARPDFERSIRMKLSSFKVLLSYIYQELLVDDLQASRRGSPIIPELCLFCTIRYLSGGSYLDIRFLTGISVPSLYRIMWKTMLAIVACPQLQVKFPKTDEELKESALGFESVSTGGCMSNCITVIDGYHLAIQTPPKKEAKNVQSFFSGHYQSYGVNIQAACDHNCRFQFIGIGGPGVMSDRDAINESGLGELVNNLPGMYCAIGDCAYVATEHLVPIFGGAQAKTSSTLFVPLVYSTISVLMRD